MLVLTPTMASMIPPFSLSHLLPDISTNTYMYPAKANCHNPNLHVSQVPTPNPLVHFAKNQKPLLYPTQQHLLLRHLLPDIPIKTFPAKMNSCKPNLYIPISMLILDFPSNLNLFPYLTPKKQLLLQTTAKTSDFVPSVIRHTCFEAVCQNT